MKRDIAIYKASLDNEELTQIRSVLESKDDLSKALEKIYTDESLRQSLSQGAFERAKDFSWDSKIDRLNTIYNELLKD